jgi:hypothetical protein
VPLSRVSRNNPAPKNGRAQDGGNHDENEVAAARYQCSLRLFGSWKTLLRKKLSFESAPIRISLAGQEKAQANRV